MAGPGEHNNSGTPRGLLPSAPGSVGSNRPSPVAQRQLGVAGVVPGAGGASSATSCASLARTASGLSEPLHMAPLDAAAGASPACGSPAVQQLADVISRAAHASKMVRIAAVRNAPRTCPTHCGLLCVLAHTSWWPFTLHLPCGPPPQARLVAEQRRANAEASVSAVAAQSPQL